MRPLRSRASDDTESPEVAPTSSAAADVLHPGTDLFMAYSYDADTSLAIHEDAGHLRVTRCWCLPGASAGGLPYDDIDGDPLPCTSALQMITHSTCPGHQPADRIPRVVIIVMSLKPAPGRDIFEWPHHANQARSSPSGDLAGRSGGTRTLTRPGLDRHFIDLLRSKSQMA